MTQIVFTLDKHYFPYFFCALQQIARFGRQAECIVVVVPPETDEHSLELLRSAANHYNLSIRSVLLQPHEIARLTCFKPLSFGGEGSFATYIRLMLPELLLDLDEILYLDVDILIRAPLDELLQWKLENPLAAVNELVGTGQHIFGSSHIPYFNAGVLRMSLERMRQLRTWDSSIGILQSVDAIRWYDQDVLNILFTGKFDSLPLSYNVSDMLIRGEFGIPLFQDPAIVHFNGPMKPWQAKLTSKFAREWRHVNTTTGFFEHAIQNRENSVDIAKRMNDERELPLGRTYRNVRTSFSDAARSLLPTNVKRMVKRGIRAFSERSITKLEQLQSFIESPSPSDISVNTVVQRPQLERILSATPQHTSPQFPSQGLDLMISVARSGTNALGQVIQGEVPELNWLNEYYLGGGWSNFSSADLSEKFPWFTEHSPERIEKISPQRRMHAFKDFCVSVSEHAVDLTRIALEGGRGRTLIKIFPEQLLPSALQEVLHTFRPRVLFVRRELIFSYVSRLRANNLDAINDTYASSWMNKDVTDVKFNIDERDTAHYVAQCDHWFDTVAALASELGLQRAFVTYRGLFESGGEVPLIRDFYPNGTFCDRSESDRLVSNLMVQDRRSDGSVLDILKAISGLSASAQANLLRLPGKTLKSGY